MINKRKEMTSKMKLFCCNFVWFFNQRCVHEWPRAFCIRPEHSRFVETKPKKENVEFARERELQRVPKLLHQVLQYFPPILRKTTLVTHRIIRFHETFKFWLCNRVCVRVQCFYRNNKKWSWWIPIRGGIAPTIEPIQVLIGWTLLRGV